MKIINIKSAYKECSFLDKNLHIKTPDSIENQVLIIYKILRILV